MTIAIQPAVLTQEEAAAYLSTTPRHLRCLRAEGALVAVKIGRKVRYRREDLDGYIERRVEAA